MSKVIAAIDKIEKPCQFCGETSWGVGPNDRHQDRVQIMVLANNPEYPRRVMDLVPLTCMNCGLTHFMQPKILLENFGDSDG